MESGLPSSDVASAEELVEQIRIAKNDDRIKALVLRVDSLAAARLLELRELLALQATGKPVVVICRGGSLWRLLDIRQRGCNLRGTHNHYRLHWHLRHCAKLLREFGCLGIYTDGVSSAPLARGMSVVGSLSDQAKNILQLSVEHGYAEFMTW